MKKILSITLVISLVFALCVIFASCGETKPADDTKADDVTTAAVVDTDAADETTDEETTEAEPVNDGSVNLLGYVTMEVPEGWAVEEASEDKVKIKKADAGSFDFDNVTVEVSHNWSHESGEELAIQQNKNYQEKGTVSTVEINGVTYYKVSGVVDDDTQNMFITELDEDYYLEISVMYMPLDDGMPVVNAVVVNK